MSKRVYKTIFWSILLSLLAICWISSTGNQGFNYQYYVGSWSPLKQSEYQERDSNNYRMDDTSRCPMLRHNIFQSTNPIQLQRQAILDHKCQTNRLSNSASNGSSFTQKLNNNIALYDPMGFLYCRIQKVGSTFLQKTIRNVFADLKFIAPRGNTMLVNRSKDFIDCLPKTSKFMFVREPYGRALSGYVDKLFAPNPFFWRSAGRFIIKTIRGLKASPLSLKCGHDVTFPEFMKYVIHAQKTLTHRDRHFYPMYEHCFPCDIKYDFIGKMETFRDDVSHILDVFNSTFSRGMTFENFEKESDLQIASTHINHLFSFKGQTLHCEPFRRSFQRVWRDLQIRGVLPIDTKMPFILEKMNTINQTHVTDVVTRIIQNVQNRTKLKEQRQEAKVEAFSQLSADIITEYRELYRLDFELFDYPTLPDFVKIAISTPPKHLKYFDIF